MPSPAEPETGSRYASKLVRGFLFLVRLLAQSLERGPDYARDLHLRDADPLADLALGQVLDEAQVQHLAVPLVEQVGGQDENLDQVEYNVMLEERLEQLSDRDREVLHLSFVEDLTQSEIGERIGVSQMQVSRIIRSSLERLREEPGEGEDSPKEV